VISRRRIPARVLLLASLPSAGLTMLWALVVYGLFAVADLEVLRIPFLPLSTIGIAVSFYVGFKNNASYDRFWEGRKIWGGVVNTSRSWGTAVTSYILPQDASPQAHKIRETFIYRHLAWTNALRLQLRRKSRFEDAPAWTTKRRLDRHREHMRNDWDSELEPFLSDEELREHSARGNPATHILNRQGAELAKLLKTGQLDLFHQIAMMNFITELYALQGKAERIKNTPLPRQYAEYSRVLVRVFVVLAPFGLLDVFADNIEAAHGPLEQLVYLIPFLASAALIGWTFIFMEAVGDASEDPFERGMNDVPMNALSRTIERDMRAMLGEPEDSLLPKEESIDGILY
jgi:putative membrane protein